MRTPCLKTTAQSLRSPVAGRGWVSIWRLPLCFVPSHFTRNSGCGPQKYVCTDACVACCVMLRVAHGSGAFAKTTPWQHRRNSFGGQRTQLSCTTLHPPCFVRSASLKLAIALVRPRVQTFVTAAATNFQESITASPTRLWPRQHNPFVLDLALALRVALIPSHDSSTHCRGKEPMSTLKKTGDVLQRSTDEIDSNEVLKGYKVSRCKLHRKRKVHTFKGTSLC